MKSLFLVRWGLVASMSVLAACGGGGGGGGSSPTPSPSPGPTPPPPGTARGSLLGSSVSGTISVSAINSAVATAEKGLVGDTAKCPVKLVSLTYATVAPDGSSAQASAGLLVPGNGCTGPFPLLSQNHGTATQSSFSLTQTTDAEVLSAAAYFGSQGYVTVLPDYLGYGQSSLDYHPYLQAENSGAVVLDALRAARHWLSQNSVALNGQVFLAGTSEGGYVTMAAQKVIERDAASEFTLTGVGAASGPYNLPDTFTQFLSTADDPDASKSPVAVFVLTSLQRTYGDLWSSPEQVFNSQWAASMPGLLPGTSAESDLFKNCLLPFNLKDAPSPVANGCGNATSIPLLQSGWVTDYLNGSTLFNNSAVATKTRVAAQNLLTGWVPQAPLGICYGTPDTMAAPNALAAQAYFNGRGFTKLQVENVETDTTEPIKTWIATQEPLHPVGAGYHGRVEANACVSWIRHQLFDPLR